MMIHLIKIYRASMMVKHLKFYRSHLKNIHFELEYILLRSKLAAGLEFGHRPHHMHTVLVKMGLFDRL